MNSKRKIPVAEPAIGKEELDFVNEAVTSGWVSSAGSFIGRFEKLFAEYCDAKYAFATTSGTSALHLALESLDITFGDEVIVPTFSFIATANAVSYNGAKPIFVDSENTTWNIAPELIEAAVSEKTKAIIPVHLYGHPAKMDAILQVASKYNLSVIEDAAEAHGALYKGRKVGNIGTMGCFSFYGNKTITTGEGGMIVTDNVEAADRLKLLRDHGMSSKHRYLHTVLGYNYRMTNLQAALGVAQLNKIESLLDAKNQIAVRYNKLLKTIPGINLPTDSEWAVRSTWLYTLTVDKDLFGKTRDELMVFLDSCGIDTRPAFPPMHMQPIYNTGQSLPIAEKLSETGISLPSSVNLLDSEIDRVAKAIKTFYERK